MNIDERLEALAQSVELLAGMQRDREAAQRVRDTRIDQLHAEMMLAIARLATPADGNNGQLADYPERIESLEGK